MLSIEMKSNISMMQKLSTLPSNVFKALCVLAAFFMVLFWVLKFHENEDVSAINFTSYDIHRNITYPEMSMCITEPFIYQNLLWNWEGNDTAKQYVWYLAGTIEDTSRKTYEQISFFNVTLNIFDYVESVRVYKRNVAFLDPLLCTTLENCPYIEFKNNFNGFFNGMVMRCFGFDVNLKVVGNVKALEVSFKQELPDILHTISRSGFSVNYLAFNYPGQVLKNTENYQPVWKNPGEILEYLNVKISAVEILRRRNKNNDPCHDDWMHFDDMVLKKHHHTIGCVPPYHQSNKSVCTTKTEMAASRYEINEIGNRYYPAPCEGMSNIVFTADEVPYNITDNRPRVYFTYPEKIKIIQQIKSVDVHSLIGNIGGYIGLFLGKNDRFEYRVTRIGH